MYYKNITNSVKTFYNVEFKPGEVQEVPGHVNAKGMIQTSEKPVPKVALPIEKKEVKEVKEVKKKEKSEEITQPTTSEDIITKPIEEAK